MTAAERTGPKRPQAGPKRPRAGLMRPQAGPARVTNVELFFDLVFVFAVTQLSHSLQADQTLPGAARTALLIAMVWLLWAYTTWVTNWLDPDRLPVRLLLLVLALLSLAYSAALPVAFGRYGLIIGAGYLVMQAGRSAFTVAVIGDPALRRNFQRILAWCAVSGLLALAGGLTAGWPAACSGPSRSPSTSPAARWGFALLASAGRPRRTGPSKAATSPSAARVSS